MKNYQNYHSHKWYTNIFIADSPCGYQDYIDRALELGQTVITSVEHGYQGNYWLLHKMIKETNEGLQERRDKGEENVPNNLKFVFGTEAYWVKDRHVNDRSNCHMIILAKNERGRKAINLALSIANEDGMFGGRPRLDFELIFKLPPEDVFVTTACVGYWNKYDDIEDITLRFSKHFGDNFMLEVQTHNTQKQRELNTKILKMSKKYGIKLIAGMDSHLITEEEDIKRDVILKYKGINYADEEGWFLDYPSYDEAFKRFQVQEVLSDSDIAQALENTNLIANFEDITLNTDIKLPTMHPTWTQKEKDKELVRILNKEWKEFKSVEGISKEEQPKYIDGIKYETGEVIKTKMTDYFLIHYEALKRGKAKGGRVTKRGRGSAVGFFINTLLGFSKVDRFKAPIKLYPERFLTADRILKSRTLPDVDNNVDVQEPFVEAFRELIGYHGVYPMIAFGTLKKSSAIKLYMGAEDIDASIQNEVTKQLKEYDKVIKHCETDEEKDNVDIRKYITEEYVKYVDLSAPYQGIVIQKSAHPCAFLLLNGDIREEIGLVRCESESTGKSVLTACIDGAMADYYKFLKTDLLIVDVVGLTEDIWERIGETSITNNELERRLASEEGKKAWDIYEKGYTLCVNQCEKEATKHKAMKYKMRNTAELSAFVAGIRPAFASLLNNFLERRPYSTGVPELDEVLKDSYHYMLYQESIMAYLNWLGVDMKETYDIVKKISKKVYEKNPELMQELKDKCKPHWLKNVGTYEGFEPTWKVMNDAGSYAFNSAHSYCVGNDGAEIAYLKAYYPYETYEVCLNRFSKKKNKDKVTALKIEMKEAFGISEGELKFGLDNRQFTLDKANKCIHPCLSSIKDMGKNVASEIYILSQSKAFDNFYELLIAIEETSITSKMLDILIKIDYFKDFGKINKLLVFVKYYRLFHGKKAPKKDTVNKNISDKNIIDIIERNSVPTKATYTKFKDVECLMQIWNYLPNEDCTQLERIKYNFDLLGYIDYKNPNLSNRIMFITNIDDKHTPYLTLYCLKTGKLVKMKYSKRTFRKEPVEVMHLIYIHDMEKKDGWKVVGKDDNGEPIFEQDSSKTVLWINKLSILENNEII